MVGMIPGVAMPGPSSNTLVGQKRKYQPDDVTASRPLSDEDEYMMSNEPELADELYCIKETSIVGVQYYNGTYSAHRLGFCFA